MYDILLLLLELYIYIYIYNIENIHNHMGI